MRQIVVGLSISMFHRLSVNFNFACNFRAIGGTLAIFNIHIPGSKHIQYAMNVDHFMTVMHLLWITPLEHCQFLHFALQFSNGCQIAREGDISVMIMMTASV